MRLSRLREPRLWSAFRLSTLIDGRIASIATEAIARVFMLRARLELAASGGERRPIRRNYVPSACIMPAIPVLAVEKGDRARREEEKMKIQRLAEIRARSIRAFATTRITMQSAIQITRRHRHHYYCYADRSWLNISSKFIAFIFLPRRRGQERKKDVRSYACTFCQFCHHITTYGVKYKITSNE